MNEPTNLSNDIIYISKNEKEVKKYSKLYFHLVNFNPIKEEDIKTRLEKEKLNQKSLKNYQKNEKKIYIIFLFE